MFASMGVGIRFVAHELHNESIVFFEAAYGWLLWDEVLMWWAVAGTLFIASAGMLAARAVRQTASR